MNIKLPFLAKLVIVILLTVALSELAPDLVNAILFLILVGILLSHWKNFSGLFSVIKLLGDDIK